VGRLIDALPLDYTDSVVLVGAVLIGVSSGVLGAFAVFRERSLVGDAIAHATLPGVCLAFLVAGAKDAATLAVGAGLAGLTAAALIVAVERTGRIRPDAAIGVVLSAFFSLGVVLLTYLGNYGSANQAGLDNYLFGQAAGLLERDLEAMGALCLASLAAVALAFRPLKATLFDRRFAGSVGLPVAALELAMTALLVVAIMIGVRTVGAILMVAMLIVPAVVARQLTDRLSTLLPVAGLVGAAVGAVGALLSESAALPTGPVIVVTGFAAALAAILLAPGRGVAWRARQALRDRRRAATEGVLLDLETALHAGPPPTAEELALGGGRPAREVRRALRDLDRAGMLERDGDRIRLSESGAAAAHALLARRRLWAAWLEHGGRLRLPDAREPDPSDLRGSLGDAAADELERLAAAGGEW